MKNLKKKMSVILATLMAISMGSMSVSAATTSYTWTDYGTLTGDIYSYGCAIQFTTSIDTASSNLTLYAAGDIDNYYTGALLRRLDPTSHTNCYSVFTGCGQRFSSRVSAFGCAEARTNSSGWATYTSKINFTLS